METSYLTLEPNSILLNDHSLDSSPFEDQNFDIDTPRHGELQEYTDSPVDASQTRRESRNKKKMPLDPNLKVGHWTLDEKRQYHWFLQIYHSHFEHKHMRRLDKIFKTMADTLGTRAADQCRSHHQKMEKKYGNFYSILRNFRRIYYQNYGLEKLTVDLVAQGRVLHEALIPAGDLQLLAANYTQPPKPIRSNTSPRRSRKKQPELSESETQPSKTDSSEESEEAVGCLGSTEDLCEKYQIFCVEPSLIGFDDGYSFGGIHMDHPLISCLDEELYEEPLI